jgi:TATA-binding protein-associated factor Taf7
MSLSAIQDNLLKTNLVQQTQTKGDDVVRGQQNAVAAVQKEENRRQDEVVLSTRESEQKGVRSDEEKGNGRDRDEDDEEKERREKEEEEEEDTGPRARMRRINIVI